MRARWVGPVVIAAVLLAAACSSDDEGSSTGPDATEPQGSVQTVPPPTGTEELFVEPTQPAARADAAGIVIESIVFEGGVSITLTNAGAEPYDLTGHFLCNRPNYAPVDAGVLEPGDFVEIDGSVVGLTAESGELGLYEGQDFGDPNSIVRYVQWGSADNGRVSTAIEAGVWADGSFVDNGGSSIFADGDDPIRVTDWSIG